MPEFSAPFDTREGAVDQLVRQLLKGRPISIALARKYFPQGTDFGAMCAEAIEIADMTLSCEVTL